MKGIVLLLALLAFLAISTLSTRAETFNDQERDDVILEEYNITDLPLNAKKTRLLCTNAFNCAPQSCMSVLCLANICIYLPVYDGCLCNDNDPCSATSSCTGGVCVGASWTNCDDSNPCTIDSCNSGSKSCNHVGSNSLIGTACDDGNWCTIPDYCGANGVCLPGSPRCISTTCTTSLCDSVNQVCTPIYNDYATCDDGNSTTINDYCLSGVCKGYVPSSTTTTTASVTTASSSSTTAASVTTAAASSGSSTTSTPSPTTSGSGSSSGSTTA